MLVVSFLSRGDAANANNNEAPSVLSYFFGVSFVICYWDSARLEKTGDKMWIMTGFRGETEMERCKNKLSLISVEDALRTAADGCSSAHGAGMNKSLMFLLLYFLRD